MSVLLNDFEITGKQTWLLTFARHFAELKINQQILSAFAKKPLALPGSAEYQH